jgi:rod shape-determining protein MreD
MKGVARLAGVGLALVLGQVFLSAMLPPQVRPDLLLVFALAMGLRSGGTRGLFLAFALGFVADVLSGSPLGLFALLRGTACALTRVLDRALYLRAPLPWTAYVAGYTLLDGILMGLALRVFLPESAIGWGTILGRMPGEIVLTALVAAPLLLLFLRLDVDTEPDGRRSGLGLIGTRS